MKKTAKILLVLVVIITICSATIPSSALQNQCSTTICVNTPTPCDKGGGKWNDQNYVLLAPLYLNLKDASSNVTEIYYKGERMYLDYHGHDSSDKNYVWGISTKWAYVHPGWKDSGNWEMRFR